MPKSRQSSPKDEILRLRCSPAAKMTASQFVRLAALAFVVEL